MANPGQKAEKDHQEGLENARKNLDTGSTNEIKEGHSRTQPNLYDINLQHWLELNGLDATAELLAITDTGTLIDSNPVMLLTLKVQPAMIAAEFKTTGKTMVSKMAIPRVGDRLKLKYNPANLAQFIVVPI